MATYRRSYRDNRRTGMFRIILSAIAGLSLITTIGFGIRLYIIDKSLEENQTIITTIKQENVQLEGNVPKFTEEAKTLQLEVENLKDILWKYEPIIIPDSMK